MRQGSIRLSIPAAVAGLPLLLAPNIGQVQVADHAVGSRPEMQRLAGLVGSWSVELEGRNGPDDPFKRLDATPSSITAILGGAFLQEHFVLPTPDGQRVEMIGLWGYDRYRDRYRFAWLDDSFALFDVFEGAWQDGKLVVDNLRSGTTIVGKKAEFHGRMIWGPFEGDGFAVESQVSADGGKTWFTQARGQYRRAN